MNQNLELPKKKSKKGQEKKMGNPSLFNELIGLTKHCKLPHPNKKDHTSFIYLSIDSNSMYLQTLLSFVFLFFLFFFPSYVLIGDDNRTNLPNFKHPKRFITISQSNVLEQYQRHKFFTSQSIHSRCAKCQIFDTPNTKKPPFMRCSKSHNFFHM